MQNVHLRWYAVAKHSVALWRPLCQITRGNAGFRDSGILGELHAGSGVLLVRCKSTSSSPHKGLLGWDRSWGFESQVRQLNYECHFSAYLFLWTSANCLFLPWRTSSNPEDAHNLSPSANTTWPIAVAIAKGGLSNTWWLVSMGMMLLLAQWYVEWVNLHVGGLLHAGQAQHLFSADYILHLNHSLVQLL